jgi:DNA-binding CsgD family transcriptional regulator
MFLREAARPDFTASEAAVVASVSRHVAHGLRAAMLRPAATLGRDEEGPGVIVIDGRDEIESITRPGERWLSEAQTVDVPTIGRLPSAVLAVAAQARPGATGGAPARARLQLRSGRWVLLHAAALDDAAHGRVAVIVEPAGAHELAPLLVRAYGLTAREREVVAAVLSGLSTGEIAARLWLSPHTVQDHLKAIFDKTGARSRRELMARLFYDHLEPLIAADAEPGIDGLPLAREDPSTLG